MLPVAEDASSRTLALFHSRLPAEDQGRVVEALVFALG